MPMRSLSLVTQTASRPFDPETGSQTTEYALIMVVTANKLRGYDDLSSSSDRPELAHASRDLCPHLPSCRRLDTRHRAPGAALPGIVRAQRLGGRRGLPGQRSLGV